MTEALTAAPDWSQQVEDLTCPLCGYNLRGLSEPRCPECGHRFEWRQLLDPSARIHPYLFEHHPSRNIWSFVQTTLHALLPGRFWKSLHPAQRSRPGRLVLYWIAGSLLLLIPAGFGFFNAWNAETTAARAMRERMRITYQSDPQLLQRITQSFGSLQNYLDRFYSLPLGGQFLQLLWFRHRFLMAFSCMAAAYLAWPWVAMLILMIFQQSMRGARIFPSHVMRCTIYSAHIGWPLLAAVIGGFLISPPARLYFWIDRSHAWLFALLIVWGGTTFGLVRAYRRYLRFDHSIAVVLSVQIIFALLAVQAAIIFLGWEALKKVIFF